MLLLLGGCGLKGPLTMPARGTGEVVIRGPAETTPPAEPAPAPESTEAPATEPPPEPTP